MKNTLLTLALMLLAIVVVVAMMPHDDTTLIITPPRVYASSGPYNVTGEPSITASVIHQVLCSHRSPACGTEQALYDLGVKYGIDPAFALAFFQHESSYGTRGEARVSLSLGNLRCIPGFACRDGYAWFTTWQSGYVAWYQLIHNLYVAQWHLTTIEQIIPRYAPNADGNNEQAYILAVENAVDSYRSM